MSKLIDNLTKQFALTNHMMQKSYDFISRIHDEAVAQSDPDESLNLMSSAWEIGRETGQLLHELKKFL